MNGEELLDLYPSKIIDSADTSRLSKLVSCKNEEEFSETLKEMAQRCYPIWIFGCPRTGSSWLTKRFFGSVFTPVFKEPWEFIQCQSVAWNEETINIRKNSSYPRPEIIKKLQLFKPPVDRFTLAIHRRFVFKYLFDFSIVDKIIEYFPRSRFIWITRDGRDLVDSFANPHPEHWPQNNFNYLGEDREERFRAATDRFVDFTLLQSAALKKHKRRILRVKYENFRDRFAEQAHALLKFSGIQVNKHTLKRIEKEFESRHGMWKSWENWQIEYFQKTGATRLNRMLGYALEEKSLAKPWKLSFAAA